VLDLWPENVEVFELFLGLDLHWQLQAGLSQVRWAPPTPESARAVMAMQGLGRKRQRRLYGDLCGMQRSALEILNEAQ